MSYVLYHVDSTVLIKHYDTLGAARRGMRASNRNAGYARTMRCWVNESEFEHCVNATESKFGPYAIATYDAYYRKVVTTKKVINIMSGKEVEIASNTPLCCDPSSETYWSM